MKLRCISGHRWLPIARTAALLLAASCTVQAQQSTSGAAPNYTPGTNVNVDRMDMAIPESRLSLAKRQAFIRAEQHKHMVENTNRLLQLTQQFQAETHGRGLTTADGKRLDEIAKLAHTVREQMVGH